MALIERPYTTSFTKNEIRYVFLIESLERPGLALQVKLRYKKIQDTTFTDLETFNLVPDSEGFVYLPVQQYLNSLTNYIMPLPGTVVNTADEQAVNFYVEYRELTDETPDPDWTTTEVNHILTAIKGGIEKNKFSRNNFFINYLETAKPFLTWQPVHFVYNNENVFLSFLNPAVGTEYKIKIAVYDTAGGVTYYFITVDGTSLLYHLNIGPSLLNYSEFDIGYYYEVSIINSDNTDTKINPYRLYLEKWPAYRYYDLVYFNSLGGLDSVRVRGEIDISFNRNYAEGEGGLKLQWNAIVNPHESTQVNILLQRKFSGDIGYLRTRNRGQQESFMDLLSSKNVYQLIDGRWIPVNTPQKNINLGSTTDTIQSFPIEWEFSEWNEVYTPTDKLFGAGSVVAGDTNGLIVISISNTDSTHATVFLGCNQTVPPANAYTTQLTRLSTGDVSYRNGSFAGIIFSGLIRGETYQARVRGLYDNGPGPWYDPITFTVPA